MKKKLRAKLKSVATIFNSKSESLLKSILATLKELLSYLKDKDKKKTLTCRYDDKDDLQIYRGYDIIVSEKIIIHQPSLHEICEYSEKKYWSMVHLLTSVGADMKWQLFDMGIDYTEIKDFDLFSKYLCHGLSQEDTSIVLGNLDLSKFGLFKNTETDELFMYDQENEIIIDEYTYTVIVDILRKIHGFKRNNQVPANESTKMILIEDDRDEYNRNKNKEYHSVLKNMVSAMINSEGFKYNHDEVWNMKINAFMDSVRRIGKIKNADLLFQSGYSGFGVNLKEISNKQLDWLGELE